MENLILNQLKLFAVDFESKLKCTNGSIKSTCLVLEEIFWYSFYNFRLCDPPGQKSVYIPPGDTSKEAYRLSTFLRFPQTAPVNPSELALIGFFYTGYKDRVKCFSCAISVEGWMVGDDPKDSRWHRPNCAFIKGEKCGNIRIGIGN